MRWIILLLAITASAARAGSEPDLLLQQRLKAHIEFLAADELRGRLPGTQGYNIAARYVVSQFRQLGLLPAGTGGSYFQQVPIRQAWLEEGSASMALNREGLSRDFEFLQEFYIKPSTGFTNTDLTAELVFAGYGIHAPELDYNDFSQIDVAGKIAVTLGGQPLEFPSEEGAHFGSTREKARALAMHGAIGWITVYTPRNRRRFEWDRVRDMVGMPAMGWLQQDGTPFAVFRELKARAMIHYRPAQILFEGAEYTLSELLEKDEAGEALPVFPIAGTVHLAQKSRHETIHSPNVAGVLPGSDPLLSNEYMVYTAHLDHIGELHGEGHEDAINNGALDNAAGVSVMLETARMFSESGAARRSILFLAVTAEEKGLVGSEYFAHNPTVPIEAMVAAINLDMPLLLYDFGDVIAFGAEHSTLGETVRRAAGEFGITLTPDPFPEQNIFVRSDHYRFVQQGIPSVFLVTGPKSLDGEVDTLPIFQGFLKEHYHKPSDDLNLPINYRAAARFTRINARAGEIIANETKRPQWHEGDFFGTTFSR